MNGRVNQKKEIQSSSKIFDEKKQSTKENEIRVKTAERRKNKSAAMNFKSEEMRNYK